MPAAPSGARRSFGRAIRGWRRVLVAVAILVTVFAAATGWLLIWPPQGMPRHVSAIVMLDGPGARLPVAVNLAQEHRAPVLLVSQGVEYSGDQCPGAVPRVKLICFHPDPADTRGETEHVGRLAKRYHWASVVLVTTREQDVRARLMMRRCYSGAVYVVTAPRPWYQWPEQIAYGWGALFKAVFLKRSC